ncbi:MAG: GGDEF domain-containing protein [Planctomycetota bacterium]
MSFFAELKQLEDQGIDLLEILGHDRHLDTPSDLQSIIRTLSRSTENLYGELLYYLTYRRFSAEEAETMWAAIMAHKIDLEASLRRGVSFRVAALDYFTQNGILTGVHLLSKSEFEGILSFVNVDEVTAVFSRRYFNVQLARELTRARRYGSPLSLLLIDLDEFKSINDALGHVEGDIVLRKVGRLLRDSTRQVDSVCRFGGDEFAVILPETNADEAHTTAERIRRAMSRVDLPKTSSFSGRVSTSIGGATFPIDCEEVEELMALADRMCLDAKKSGKNCTRFHRSSNNGDGGGSSTPPFDRR